MFHLPIYIFLPVQCKYSVHLWNLRFQIIHMRGFSEPEIQQFVISVRDNLIDSMVVLVDAMDVLGIIFEKGVCNNLILKVW